MGLCEDVPEITIDVLSWDVSMERGSIGKSWCRRSGMGGVGRSVWGSWQESNWGGRSRQLYSYSFPLHALPTTLDGFVLFEIFCVHIGSIVQVCQTEVEKVYDIIVCTFCIYSALRGQWLRAREVSVIVR